MSDLSDIEKEILLLLRDDRACYGGLNGIPKFQRYCYGNTKEMAIVINEIRKDAKKDEIKYEVVCRCLKKLKNKGLICTGGEDCIPVRDEKNPDFLGKGKAITKKGILALGNDGN